MRGLDPRDRGSNPRGETSLARSMAEHPVEARAIVVRFHGQAPCHDRPRTRAGEEHRSSSVDPAVDIVDRSLPGGTAGHSKYSVDIKLMSVMYWLSAMNLRAVSAFTLASSTHHRIGSPPSMQPAATFSATLSTALPKRARSYGWSSTVVASRLISAGHPRCEATGNDMFTEIHAGETRMPR